jgi:hypothetical protein
MGEKCTLQELAWHVAQTSKSFQHIKLTQYLSSSILGVFKAMGGFILDIYSDSEKVKEMLENVVKHNDSEFAKAGFTTQYFKEDFGYSLTVMPFTITANMGFAVGKPILIRGLKAELKKIDESIRIVERKGEVKKK